jgi:hypothetical protein
MCNSNGNKCYDIKNSKKSYKTSPSTSMINNKKNETVNLHLRQNQKKSEKQINWKECLCHSTGQTDDLSNSLE